MSPDVPIDRPQDMIQGRKKWRKVKVSYPENNDSRHPLKGVLEVKTKRCRLLIRFVGSLYTMIGKVITHPGTLTPTLCGARKLLACHLSLAKTYFITSLFTNSGTVMSGVCDARQCCLASPLKLGSSVKGSAEIRARNVAELRTRGDEE